MIVIFVLESVILKDKFQEGMDFVKFAVIQIATWYWLNFFNE